MRASRKWGWGFLPLTLLAVIMLNRETAPIEHDLTERATAALTANGHAWASVSADGLDLSLAGEAPTPEARAAAASLLGGLWGVNAVDNAAGVIPIRAPYRYRLMRDHAALTVSGHIPNVESRDRAVSALETVLPAAAIDDDLERARGGPAPEIWGQALDYAARLVAAAPVATVSIVDADISVSALAEEGAGYAAIVAALAAPPPGFAIAQAAIVPPQASPYLFEAERRGAVVRVGGHVPALGDRETVMARLSGNGSDIDGKLSIASGAPPGWIDVVTAAADALFALDPGRVAITGRAITLEGVAVDGAAFGLIEEFAAQNRNGFVVDRSAVEPPPIDTYFWQAELTVDGLALTGFIPDEAARTAVLANLGEILPGVPIFDAMDLASGAPDGMEWVDRIGIMAQLLEHVAPGTVQLSENRVSISGTARDQEAYRTLKSALGALPPPLVADKIDIRPPRVSRFWWELQRNDEGLMMSGYSPNAAVAQALARKAENTLSSPVVMDLRAASGLADTGAFEQAAERLIDMMQHLTAGGMGRIDDQILSLAGTARDRLSYRAIRDMAAKDLPSGYRFGVFEIDPPRAQPYTWSATRTTSGTTLNGHVPSASTQATLLDSAEILLAGDAINDLTILASGAPPVFESHVVYALRHLTFLSDGTVDLGEEGLSVTGTARTHAALDDLQDLASEAPRGLPAPRLAIAPPLMDPFLFEALWTGDRLTLTGATPSNEVRTALLAATARLFGSVPVEVDLPLASGAPPELPSLALNGLRQLARLARGTLVISGTDVRLAGEAYTQKTVEAISKNLMESAPEEATASASLSVRPAQPEFPPVRCQEEFSEALKARRVYFDTAESVIDPDSFGLLDILVAVAQRCPTVQIEIGGHTDSRGADVYNLRLSSGRAEAVVGYLIAAGVAPTRLTAVGYGETRPIAPNATEKGRAQNRRIEFTVIE